MTKAVGMEAEKRTVNGGKTDAALKGARHRGTGISEMKKRLAVITYG